MFKLMKRKLNNVEILMGWKNRENQVLIDSPILGVVIPNEEKELFHYGNRKEFLENFVKKACSRRLIRNQHPFQVNYWYDGPCGNVGMILWEQGSYHQIKNSVIGISRLTYTMCDQNTIDIAKKAIEILIKNNNIILFLPMSNEEIEFYENFDPSVKKIDNSFL